MALRTRTPEFRDEYSSLRNIVYPWLQNPSWRPGELWSFLEGKGLPGSEKSGAPRNLLWLGILNREKQMDPTAQMVLASRTAHLLQTRPDVKLPRGRSVDSVHALLGLANSLESPHQLADPLHDIYEGCLQGLSRLDALGKDILTLALVRNQVDPRYYELWLKMTQGKPTPGLASPGGVWTGAEGLIRMPASPDSIGQPHLGAVEEALDFLALYFDEGRDSSVRDGAFGKEEGFGTAVKDMLTTAYPTYPNWSLRIREMGSRRNVPHWALDAVREAFMVRHNLPSYPL